MAKVTHRIFNELEVNGCWIIRYPMQARDGTYLLAHSVGIESNLKRNAVKADSLAAAIELMATGKFKIRMSAERGSDPSLLVLDSISIPEIGHLQRGQHRIGKK